MHGRIDEVRWGHTPVHHLLPQSHPRCTACEWICQLRQMLKQKRAARIIEYEIAVCKATTGRQCPIWFGNPCGDLEFSTLILNFERHYPGSGEGSRQHVHALCPSQR